MGVRFRCEYKQHGYFLTEEERDLCPNHTVHRHPLKVAFNPLLRKLGFVIVSHFSDGGDFQGLELRKYRGPNK
jgi:hypothetical protein